MRQKKEETSLGDSVKYIQWFFELNKDSIPLAGGKGANLSEIYNLGIPVPPGFVITSQAYEIFIREAGIKEKIKSLLEGIDFEDTLQLNSSTEKIRKLIADSEFPEEIEKEIIEAYEDLGVSDEDIEKGEALDILNTAKEPSFVAVRSSATTEDLKDASFAGQQETYLNVKGKNMLLQKIKECFASLFTSRATYYRHKKNFKDSEAKLAVVVQKMINSDKSGVIFSKDPSYNNNNTIIESVWGLGEGIVSGKITPDKYEVSENIEITDKKISPKKIVITRDSSGKEIIKNLSESKSNEQVLSNLEIKKLAQYALDLEEHYQKPQDIEFAIRDSEIFILQTRPITTMEKRIEKRIESDKKENIILKGTPASPGIAVGKVKIISKMEDLNKIQKGDILVTEMTNPDMVVTMQKCAGVITDNGGMTAHAAIVSREMGIPCIVGTENATKKLNDGEIITLDSYSGKVYKGEVAEAEKKEIEQVTEKTKTTIKTIVDLPTYAPRAAKTGIKKVGLTRMEGIIAESGKHPNYFLKNNNLENYEEIIYKGIKKISDFFNEVWVRTSDIRTNEYKNLEGAPEETEDNPMLGMHGIRFSLENIPLLKAELKALQKVSTENQTKIGVLLPQVIETKEVKKVKEILKEINFLNAKIGVMIETPAAVQIIKDLCDEGIDFISFGTNDLTQYMLAVDRGNNNVQKLYNEMHPAILKQLKYVIRVCKRAKVETSICGQAGSKKEMVKYLVENKIDSISVNADMAKEISEYVKKIEKDLMESKGDIPRQYQPKQDSNEKSIQKDIEAIEKEKREYEKELNSNS